MSKFQRFTSLESLAHVHRGQDFFDKKAVVYYGAKIKLHGTNGAVRVTPDGEVIAQSRSADITSAADNAGFARWVESTATDWAGIAQGDGDVVVYGEWAGKGIQKGDAVTMLDHKYFFVFGILLVASDTFMIAPQAIELVCPDLDDVVVLPWDTVFPAPLDYADAESCAAFADRLNDDIIEIGESDPFIFGMFGVDGPGEGWVVSPICNAFQEPTAGNTMAIDMHWYRTLAFKVKTAAHSVKKTKAAPTVIEVPENVTEFAAMFVTEARCEQGVYEIVGYADPKFTGDFLKWIGQDIKKESVLELADAGLEWKDVTKAVTNAAKTWWLERCKKIT